MTVKNIAFLSVLAAVIISGCLGSGTATSNVQFSQTAGAVITDFSFESKDVFEGDPVQLVLRMQNVGAKNMTDNSRVWVYGPVVGSTGTEIWTTSNKNNLTITLDTSGFLPPDVARKMPGSLDGETIDLVAPTIGLAPGMTRDYQFFARLCYPYSTTAYSSIKGVSKNELRISNPTPSDAITRDTAGPIQLKLVSGDTMITGRDMMLVFDVTNVGGGFSTTQTTPCASQIPDVSSLNLDKVNITVTVDGKVVSGCDSKEISVRNGKGTISCKASGITSSDPSTEHTIKATATYNYFVTKDAAITVKSNQ